MSSHTPDMSNLINYLFLILLLYILFYLRTRTNPLEYFYPQIFGTDPFTKPLSRYPECTPANNCFPGTYARTQIYHNVCQPSAGLLRQPIPLFGNCQRSLSPYYNPHV